MGRHTSCWEAFVVLLFVSTTFAECRCGVREAHRCTPRRQLGDPPSLIERNAYLNEGTVVFPDSEPCTLHTGEQGRCLPLPQCPPVLETIRERHPVSCGFEGFTQIVCCPKGEDTTPSDKIMDISPPQGYDELDCGKSAVKVIQSFGPGFGLPASTVSLIRSRRANVPLGSLADKAPITVPPPVVGGQTSERSAWPWMALIGEKDPAGINWFCGGALINEYWILTALHCFHNKKADVVRLGEHDYSTDSDGANPIDIPVAERVLYPDYIYPQGYHDLALLKLERKVTLQTFISPVCLPWGSKSEENIVNSQATVTGWGFTLFGGFPSPELMEVDIQVFPSSRCNSSYSSLLHFPDTWPSGIGEETLCAGDDDGGKDSCQGDSGGPLVTRDSQGRYVAAGIVSQGYGCGHKDYPGLYANVRYPAYLAWIKKVAFGPQ